MRGALWALGAEGLATGLLCAGLWLVAPRAFRRLRRRYGCCE